MLQSCVMFATLLLSVYCIIPYAAASVKSLGCVVAMDDLLLLVLALTCHAEWSL